MVHEGTFQREEVMISVMLDKRSLSFYSSDNIFKVIHTFISRSVINKLVWVETGFDAYSGMTRLVKHPAAEISSLIFALALNRSLAITPLELLIAFTRFLARFELIFHKTLYGSNCISQMLQNGLWKLLMTHLNAEINTH